MCGIAGIVDGSGAPVDPDWLFAACDLLRHRGPDDSGVWIDDSPQLGVGLANTRLAVLDTTPAARQPMTTVDGRAVIVFNGLIYNFRELRRELEADGAILVTQCDTEVALHACRRWGPDALNRFNGMFALCYYDRVQNAGFLARDRFGIKPLFWSNQNRRLTFAGELPALRVLSEASDEINRDALAHYVRFGFFAHPSTIYADCHRLPPATWLGFGANGPSQPQSYYRVPTQHELFAAPDDARVAIRQAIGDAVASRSVADVPLGAFLSGGVDSSIVVAHLAQQSTRPVETFTIGWRDESAYDETSFADTVARRFNTRHHVHRVRVNDLLEALPTILDHLGEPFFDSSIIPTALVSRHARQHVTVCLSGDGADELFGGYFRYLAHGYLARYRQKPAFLRAMLEMAASKLRSSKSNRVGNAIRQWRKLIRGGHDPFQRHVNWMRILSSECTESLLPSTDAEALDEELAAKIRGLTESQTVADPLNAIMTHDLQYSLTCDMLQKVDLAGMMQSLEVRVPFLDPAVVDVAMAIPSAWKLGDASGASEKQGSMSRNAGKRILREAYTDLLPESVLSRSKKGFEAPIGELLRDELRDMFRDVVTRETIDSFDLISYDAVESIHAEHIARRGEHADLLYALLSLCWWRRKTPPTRRSPRTDHRLERASR